MDEYYAAIRRLPGFLRRPLEDLSPRQAQTIHEIHLRSGRPVVLTCADGQFCLPGQGAGQGGPALTHAQLQECFYSLCEHSVHSYEQQLARGFFTLPGGHRVGVAGLFHMQGQAMKGLCTVTSLNIRIARTVTGELPAQLRDHLLGPFRGLVLVGPPGSGKTTLLRGVSALLSRAGKKVAVVDERMEIWPCGPGGFAAPVPMHCDVLSGCDKREGIISALRSLGPQVILCDELGDEGDFAAVCAGSKGGVSFVCTVHGDAVEAVEQRFCATRDQLAKSFSCIGLLAGANRPGAVQQVCWL